MSRRTQDARPAYRWAVWFLVSVGVWNFLAAGVFGFLIKLPVALTLEAWKIGELEHSATKGPMLGRTASRHLGHQDFQLEYTIPDHTSSG